MLNYVEIDSVVLRRIFFKMQPPLLYIFEEFSDLDTNCPFISAIYFQLLIRMLCAKFGRTWQSVFREVQKVGSLQMDAQTTKMFSKTFT